MLFVARYSSNAPASALILDPFMIKGSTIAGKMDPYGATDPIFQDQDSVQFIYK